MNKTRIALSTIAWLALLFSGCDSGGGAGSDSGAGGGPSGGGQSTGSGAGSTDPLSEEGCDHFFGAICEKLSSCAPNNFQFVYGTLDQCKARGPLRCKGQLQLPGNNLSHENLEACAQAIGPLSCDDAFATTGAPTGCEDLFRGTLASGDTCALGIQCGSGQCNVESGSCGTCAAELSKGDTCDASGACALGLYCGESGKCEQRIARGGTCKPFQCEGTLQCIEGKCAEPLAEGTACDPDAYACDAGVGLVCDATEKTCVSSAAILVTQAQPCGTDANGGSVKLCQAGLFCNIEESGTIGTCKPSLEDGAACTVDAQDPCTAPATCVDGHCSTAPAICE